MVLLVDREVIVFCLLLYIVDPGLAVLKDLQTAAGIKHVHYCNHLNSLKQSSKILHLLRKLSMLREISPVFAQKKFSSHLLAVLLFVRGLFLN